ncbi:Wd40 repeat protein, partial [Globisporangium splendens]
MEPETVILALLLGLAGVLYYVYVDRPKKQQLRDAEALKQRVAQQNAERAAAGKKPKSKTKKVDMVAEKTKKQHGDDAATQTPEHPLNLHVLKGHKYGITAAAYSPNGRFVATASTDRTIRLYLRETLDDKNSSIRPQQIAIEYDHVTAMTFSCDGKTLPELVSEFSVEHKTDVHSVLMNDIGNWATIVTCAGDADTDVKFWSVTGKLLQVVNTNQVANYHCIGSKDNRYIAVAAYTPEVKIFEITREKNGNFKKVNKIMTLHGHRTGVLDLAFSGSDTVPVTRMVTVCKDASVRLWDINVRYVVNEDPKVLSNFTASEQKAYQSVDLSPNGKLLATARGHDILFVSTSDGKELSTIPNALEDVIKRIVFSPKGDEVMVVGKNCKHVKIYKTPEA